jgi:exonuclease III
VTIINIYAPAGAEKRKESDNFYKAELIYLLHQTKEIMITAGDLNCVIRAEDTTGIPAISKALQHLISGLQMHDAWQQQGDKTMNPLYDKECVPYRPNKCN